MKSRNVLPTLKRSPPFNSRGPNPHLLGRPFRQIIKSPFTKAHLPTALFGRAVVLRAPPRDQFRGARFLLLTETEPPPPPPLPPQAAGSVFGARMLIILQVVTTPTADGTGTSLLLRFDNQRYVFGNVSEGVQRAMSQRKIGVSKVENVFTTGPVNWTNHGGLMGLILTIADVTTSSQETRDAKLAERAKAGSHKKGPNVASRSLRLNIHGAKNLSHTLATSRRFIFRKGLPLKPHEIRHDPRMADSPTAAPDWKDTNINVWYMPVNSNRHSSPTQRKRSHDEFKEAAIDDEDARKVVDAVVTQMFDSDWEMDALVETTLHKAQLPAKLFVRDGNGHIQVYTGPMPGGDQTVPDIPVLIRKPWPGATVPSLPPTSPCHQSMCYIVKGHDRRGKFKPEVAESLGVPRFNYKDLTRGQNVVGKDGVIVTPGMVLEETVQGSGFAVVDLPDSSYVESLASRPEWSNDQIMKGVKVIFWILGRNVIDDERLQAFMQKMSSVEHIVSSPDTCPNMISLESVAAQTYKLGLIDPGRFPMPIYTNELSLSNRPISPSTSLYQGARAGKAIQFAPQFVHQDDDIVPFPNLRTMIRGSLSDEALNMAAQARRKISDPDFLAKIESVESDIPNRDAEVITLGTGSALPSKYRNVSATLVRVPGHGNYLFDCGENTMGQMRRTFGSELPGVLRDLKAIWISHLHADHHLGTATIIKAWNEETRVHCPSAKLIVASHNHMIDWLREYSDVEEYGFSRLVTVTFDSDEPRVRFLKPRVFTDKEAQEFGLEKIDACFVSHCFKALATVFTFPTGLKIAYSGDCRPSDAFIKIGQGATLLIHESTFEDELRGDAVAKKHSTMSEAIRVGELMGARRILLTHFSQRYQKIPLFEENFEIRTDAQDGEKANLDKVILVGFDYMRVKLGDFRKAQAFLPALQKLFEDKSVAEEDN